MVHRGKSVHIRLALPLIILQRSINAIRLSSDNVSKNSTVLHRTAIYVACSSAMRRLLASADPSEDEAVLKLEGNLRQGLQV